jgi:hypothetical protein
MFDDPLELYSQPEVRALTRLECTVVNYLYAGYSYRETAKSIRCGHARKRMRITRVKKIVYVVCRKLEIPNRIALLKAWHSPIFQEGLRSLRLVPSGQR